jgi:GNAT superfamily N-acetyltransferase
MRRAVETDDLRPLWDTAFQPDEVFFSRDYRPEKALIFTDGANPVSMLHILPRVLLMGNQILQVGYIMGVATHPAYRKQGLAGELIAAAVKIIEEQGFDCAMLIPASAALARYYDRFGLTVRGWMPKAEGIPQGVRPAGVNDIPKLAALYCRMFPYRVERGAFEWETILLEYTVLIGESGYTISDGDILHERVPVPPDSPACERAACMKPYTVQAEKLLTERQPYVNLLYT